MAKLKKKKGGVRRNSAQRTYLHTCLRDLGIRVRRAHGSRAKQLEETPNSEDSKRRSWLPQIICVSQSKISL
jgi:DNA-directed RNA polymerase specialized sigma24 family protein